MANEAPKVYDIATDDWRKVTQEDFDFSETYATCASMFFELMRSLVKVPNQAQAVKNLLWLQKHLVALSHGPK